MYNESAIFTESTIKHQPTRVYNSIWRWQYRTLRNLARPFKKLQRRILKHYSKPRLYITDK